MASSIKRPQKMVEGMRGKSKQEGFTLPIAKQVREAIREYLEKKNFK